MDEEERRCKRFYVYEDGKKRKQMILFFYASLYLIIQNQIDLQVVNSLNISYFSFKFIDYFS